ncbi:MAG TPA: hypothetical protein DGG94_23290 [Micromonosporaceae bacterium]|nr:hypothetical protein [Micromonosporaceae bacterium]
MKLVDAKAFLTRRTVKRAVVVLDLLARAHVLKHCGTVRVNRAAGAGMHGANLRVALARVENVVGVEDRCRAWTIRAVALEGAICVYQ